MSYTRYRHPAFAVGYVTVFACLVFLAILAVTGIVPLALQPPLMFAVLITMIMGGIIGLTGFFKSYTRRAYPILIVTILIGVSVVAFWALTR